MVDAGTSRKNTQTYLNTYIKHNGKVDDKPKPYVYERLIQAWMMKTVRDKCEINMDIQVQNRLLIMVNYGLGVLRLKTGILI